MGGVAGCRPGSRRTSTSDADCYVNDILADASVILTESLTSGTGRFDASDLMPGGGRERLRSGAAWCKYTQEGPDSAQTSSTRSSPAGQPESRRLRSDDDVGRSGREAAAPSLDDDRRVDRVSDPAAGPTAGAPALRRPRCPTYRAGAAGRRSAATDRAFFLLSATFHSPRRDANRGRCPLAILVWACGVFAFLGMNKSSDLFPIGSARGASVDLRRARPGHPERLPRVPRDQHLMLSLQDAQGQEFVGLDNFEFVFSDEHMLRSLRNTARVGHPRAAVRGEHRSLVRDAGRSAPSG